MSRSVGRCSLTSARSALMVSAVSDEESPTVMGAVIIAMALSSLGSGPEGSSTKLLSTSLAACWKSAKSASVISAPSVRDATNKTDCSSLSGNFSRSSSTCSDSEPSGAWSFPVVISACPNMPKTPSMTIMAPASHHQAPLREVSDLLNRSNRVRDAVEFIPISSPGSTYGGHRTTDGTWSTTFG